MKTKKPRIAALYWPTSSVGGIASTVLCLKQEAHRRKMKFDIFRSANQKTKRFSWFEESKLISGGDSFIQIDGEAPHHERNVQETAKYICANYDVVFLPYLCPHPIKSYPDPAYLGLLNELYGRVSISAMLTDGYWDTYADWGWRTLEFVDVLSAFNINYVPQIVKDYWKIKTGQRLKQYRVIDPIYRTIESIPQKKIDLIWISQWKTIKGPKSFLSMVPMLPEHLRIEAYNCGIEYYQLRSTDLWRKAIGRDTFKGFNGEGNVLYGGWVPLDKINRKLASSAYTVEFQGLGRVRYEAYKKPHFNTTTLEALAYCTAPIVPKAQTNAETRKFVLACESVSDAIRFIKTNALPEESGRDWVFDTCDVRVTFSKILGI